MTEADAARARLSDDLALVGAGDRAALARVYERTSSKLFGIALRVLNDREAAEDVLQDVYLKVWQRARSFERDRASPITWMAAIARNSAIDSRRARVRRHEESDDLIQAPATDVASYDMWRDHDDRMQLSACMGELEDHQRQFIRSAFFDGFTYAELAERASVPLGTMKSWIRRGLERLRRCLDGE
jgi:RNA polymerase sigma factor (sigma-70 family)